MGERNKDIDILRGFLILLVMVAHCLYRMNCYMTVVIIIYSFHMPLFYIIAGQNLKIDMCLKAFIYRRSIRLMGAYFMFVLVDTLMWFLLKVKSVGDFKLEIIENWQDIVLVTTESFYSFLWFLPVLLVASIIVFFIEKVNVQYVTWCLSICFIICGAVLKKFDVKSIWGIREAFVAQFFVLLGYETRKSIWNIENDILYCFACGVIWIGLIYEWLVKGGGIISYWKFEIFPINRTVMLACSGSFFWLFLFHNVGRRMRLMALEYLGKNSIFLYGFHYIFLELIVEKVVSEKDNSKTMIALSVVICLTLVFTEVFKRVKATIQNA